MLLHTKVPSNAEQQPSPAWSGAGCKGCFNLTCILLAIHHAGSRAGWDILRAQHGKSKDAECDTPHRSHGSLPQAALMRADQDCLALLVDEA